jgi:hypothetical protein
MRLSDALQEIYHAQSAIPLGLILIFTGNALEDDSAAVGSKPWAAFDSPALGIEAAYTGLFIA